MFFIYALNIETDSAKEAVNGELYNRSAKDVLCVMTVDRPAAEEVAAVKEKSEFAESSQMMTVDAGHAHCGRERCAWRCASRELSRASAPVARQRHCGVPIFSWRECRCSEGVGRDRAEFDPPSAVLRAHIPQGGVAGAREQAGDRRAGARIRGPARPMDAQPYCGGERRPPARKPPRSAALALAHSRPVAVRPRRRQAGGSGSTEPAPTPPRGAVQRAGGAQQ